jgi:isopentenyl diphosphate isomerase/L-lactate dehydrogenase-like FMN-dependent dehydrogenase/nitrite reductase/ring-hydroxylating ferredoxin subunit
MEFVRVASTKDLAPGKMLAVQLGDKQVMVVNLKGRYYAIGNLCTHQACLLSDGKLTGELVECPCHGSLFNVKTGNVQNGPAKDPESVFQVRAEQDQILVGIPEKAAPKEKTVQKSIVLAALESPQGVSDFAEEYGKPLGLRGIGAGLSFQNNFLALLKYKLKTRLITEHKEPVLETTFFGRKIEMPVLASSMSGLSYTSSMTEDEFAYCILEGARLAGTIGFTGHTSKEYKIHPGIDALRRVQGHGVNIFKPQSQEILLDLIKQSEKEKAVAVGIDIDGAGSVNFARAGKPVYRKTIRDIKELRRSTHLPFMVKGVMCVEDALAAAEAGVDAIGVSNHGGRVLDATPGVADVLPSIVKALRRTKKGRRIVVTADGAVRTGYDAMKLLALGADFALIGRPLARQALESGAEGVELVLEYVKTDIRKAMIMTSCNNLEDINEGILYRGH